MKACFKCNRVLPLGDFYRHPYMTDGHLNKCKDCTKADVSRNYRDNREHYIQYERGRAARPARNSDPVKRRARNVVARALKSGMLHRGPCAECGLWNTEAHHGDYSQPLTVTWLCRKHHLARHGKVAF